MANIKGGKGNDTLSGTQFNDTINGDGGNDTLSGLGGNDSLKGGAGNDFLYGGSGNDSLDGGDGNDYLDGDRDANGPGGPGVDILIGGDGNDTLVWDRADSQRAGGSGFDTLLILGGGTVTAPQVIDLRNLNKTQLSGIEKVDLNGSGVNKLMVTASSIAISSSELNSLTGLAKSLVVRLGADDIVDKGTGWIQTATIVKDGVSYLTYKQGASTLWIENQNHPATFGGVSTGDVQEDITLTRTATLTVSDPDAGQNSFLAESGNTTYGTFSITTGGVWTYNLNNSLANIQIMAADSTRTDSFTVHSFDGTTKVVNIMINGNNDAPTAQDGSGSFSESNAASPDNYTLNLLTALNAHDVDTYPVADTLTVTNFIQTSGPTLAFSMVGNQLSIDKTQATLDSLAQGEPMVIKFDVTISDGHGGSVTKELTLNITGVNDAPILTTLPQASAVANAVQQIDEVAAFTDVDHLDTHTISVDNSGVHYGTLTALISLDTNTASSITLPGNLHFTYDPTANANALALAQGETTLDTFNYTINDGHGGSVTKSITIQLTGVNNAPTAQDGSGSFSESNVAAPDMYTLNLLTALNAQDVDTYPIADTLTVQNVTQVFGPTVAFTFDGQQISIDKTQTALDSLAQGELAVAKFDVMISDGHGGSFTKELTLNITGVNDAPILAFLIDDTSAVGGSPFSYDISGHFTDVDVNDHLTFSATLENGNALPSWLSIDSQTGILSGTPLNADVGFIDVKITATDIELASASDTFRLTVNTSNMDPVAVAEDLVTDQNTPLSDNIITHSPQDTDADPGDTLNLVVASVSGAALTNNSAASLTLVDLGPSDNLAESYTIDFTNVGTLATLTIGTDGSITLTPKDFAAILPFGSSFTVGFDYTISDGHGGLSTAVHDTVKMNGLNDSASIGGDISGSITEDAISPVTGTLTIDDIDIGENQSIEDTGGITYGIFTVDADGQWIYNFYDNFFLQHLSEGELAYDSFFVSSFDGTAVQEVKVTIHGVNDAPTNITLSNNTIAEDVAGATIGTLTVFDLDLLDSHTFELSDPRFTVVGNQLKLKDYVALDFEQESSVNLTITARDSSGAKITKAFTINVTNDNQAFDVPFFSSNPDSHNVVFIDWRGGSFGGNTLTPFSIDGDASSLSATEQSKILDAMKILAADYAMFDINFTTLLPQTLPSGYTYETMIVGNGLLEGGQAAGVADVDVFGHVFGINGAVTATGTTFTDSQSFDYFATAISHEVGHTLNLLHQSNGTLEYSTGAGNWLPIMGSNFGFATWWYGPSLNLNGATQDDLAILNQRLAKIGDDHGDVFASATALNANNVSAKGIDNFTSTAPFGAEHDMFAFSTKAGNVTINVNNDILSPSLAFTVKFYDDNGVLLSTQTPDGLVTYNNSVTGQPTNNVQINTTFSDVSFTTNLSGGIYYVDVSSNGVYGRLGNYTVSVSSPAQSVESVLGVTNTVYIGDNLHDAAVAAVTNKDVIAANNTDNFIFGDDLVIATANQAAFLASPYTWLLANMGLWQAPDNSGVKDILSGGAGDDFIYGQGGDDTLIGGSGADVLNGGTGNDTASYVSATSGIVLDLSNPMNSTGDAAWDTYISIEIFMGSNLNDVLIGTTNVDKFNGASGDDILIGGLGADQLDGGAGIDLVSYITMAVGIIVNLSNTGLNTGDAIGDLYTSIEGIIGSPFNDTLTAAATGSILEGGAGADSLNGGSGIDTVSYAHAGAGVIANLVSPASNTGDAAGDTYVSIENLTGSNFDDTLIVTSANNVLHGLDGNDTLIGGAGPDILDGGGGDNTASYITASAGLTANLATPSTNTGDATGDTYTYISNLTGSNFDDNLVGDNSANTINGADGNDFLYGFGGNDTLSGGNGTDNLLGYEGADILDGGTGFDFARYDFSTAAVYADLTTPSNNEGDAAGDTYISIEGLVGTAFDDVLVGNASSNTLSGLAGNDVLHGGPGNDLLSGGGGSDYASYFLASAGVVVSLATPSQNTGEAAGDSYISIENLQGSDGFGDTLIGDNNANILLGQGGNDTLIGQGGNDVMEGGSGLNTFVFGLDINALFGTDHITDLFNGDTLSFSGVASLSILNANTLVTDGGSGSNVTMAVYQEAAHTNLFGSIILDGLGTADHHLISVNALSTEGYVFSFA